MAGLIHRQWERKLAQYHFWNGVHERGEIGMKRCPSCSRLLPWTAYSPAPSVLPSKRASYCRPCAAMRRKAARKRENPVYVPQKQREVFDTWVEQSGICWRCSRSIPYGEWGLQIIEGQGRVLHRLCASAPRKEEA